MVGLAILAFNFCVGCIAHHKMVHHQSICVDCSPRLPEVLKDLHQTTLTNWADQLPRQQGYIPKRELEHSGSSSDEAEEDSKAGHCAEQASSLQTGSRGDSLMRVDEDAALETIGEGDDDESSRPPSPTEKAAGSGRRTVSSEEAESSTEQVRSSGVRIPVVSLPSWWRRRVLFLVLNKL